MGLISTDLGIVAGDENPLQLELVIEPQGPVAALAVQDELVQLALGALENHFVAAAEFDT